MRFQLDEDVLEGNTIIKLPKFRPQHGEKPCLALSFYRWKKPAKVMQQPGLKWPASMLPELERGGGHRMVRKAFLGGGFRVWPRERADPKPEAQPCQDPVNQHRAFIYKTDSSLKRTSRCLVHGPLERIKWSNTCKARGMFPKHEFLTVF